MNLNSHSTFYVKEKWEQEAKLDISEEELSVIMPESLDMCELTKLEQI